MARFFDEAGHFNPPPAVSDLSTIPPDFRGMYEASERLPGKYELTEAGRELHAWFTNEIATVKADHSASMQAREAQLARERKAAQDDAVAASLGRALSASGVKPGLHKAATVVISDGAKFKVEPSFDGAGKTVVATTRNGFVQTVDDLVAEFIDSDAGEAFRGKPKAPASSYFTDMARELKEGR